MSYLDEVQTLRWPTDRLRDVGSLWMVNPRQNPPACPFEGTEEIRGAERTVMGILFEYLQNTATKNGARTYLYNLLSDRQFENEEFVGLVKRCLVATGAVLANRMFASVSEAAEYVVQVYLDGLLLNVASKYRQLQRFLPDITRQDVEEVVSTMERLNNLCRDYAHRRQHGYRSEGMMGGGMERDRRPSSMFQQETVSTNKSFGRTASMTSNPFEELHNTSPAQIDPRGKELLYTPPKERPKSWYELAKEEATNPPVDVKATVTETVPSEKYWQDVVEAKEAEEKSASPEPTRVSSDAQSISSLSDLIQDNLTVSSVNETTLWPLGSRQHSRDMEDQVHLLAAKGHSVLVYAERQDAKRSLAETVYTYLERGSAMHDAKYHELDHWVKNKPNRINRLPTLVEKLKDMGRLNSFFNTHLNETRPTAGPTTRQFVVTTDQTRATQVTKNFLHNATTEAWARQPLNYAPHDEIHVSRILIRDLCKLDVQIQWHLLEGNVDAVKAMVRNFDGDRSGNLQNTFNDLSIILAQSTTPNLSGMLEQQIQKIGNAVLSSLFGIEQKASHLYDGFHANEYFSALSAPLVMQNYLRALYNPYKVELAYTHPETNKQTKVLGQVELNEPATMLSLELSRMMTLIFIPSTIPTFVSRDVNDVSGVLTPDTHPELYAMIDKTYVDGSLNLVTFLGGIQVLVFQSQLMPGNYGLMRVHDIDSLLF